MRPMRILLAINRTFLPQRAGGIESSVHDMANALYQRGAAVTVLSRLRPSDSFGIRLLAKRALLGGRVRAEPYGLGYPVFRTPMMTRDLPSVLRQVRPDVAVFQVAEHFDLGYLIAKSGIPTILHIRGAEIRAPLPFQPDAVIANSEFTAAYFENRYGIPATVIHNVISARAYRVRPSGNQVVFINPVKKKGLDIALGLARSNPDIPFLFVEGWPQPKKALSRLLETLQTLPNVTFWRRQQDMRPVYESARVVLVPSQWEEAWGRVISEAQFSGIPVLASDRGGIPEALGPGGLLLPPNDFDAWQDALRRVWDDPDYWATLSLAASEHSQRDELNPDHITDHLLHVLRKAVDK